MSRIALVIDDEQDITFYLETLLEDHGWTAYCANSADEGLDLFHEKRPDVVILDVMMPEMGGLATLVAIRKDPELSRTPVVILTGVKERLASDFRIVMDRLERHRVDAILGKPVQPQTLIKTLEDVVQALPARGR
jgi:CheY-like chemotaxis protein